MRGTPGRSPPLTWPRTIHSLTHAPLTRVDFPTRAKPPTYQCRLTTYQSPSQPTETPAKAAASDTVHSKDDAASHSDTQTHKAVTPAWLDLHVLSLTDTHRHVHPSVTHPLLAPSHTHTHRAFLHSHPACLHTHGQAHTSLNTRDLFSLQITHIHTQCSCICTHIHSVTGK